MRNSILMIIGSSAVLWALIFTVVWVLMP